METLSHKHCSKVGTVCNFVEKNRLNRYEHNFLIWTSRHLCEQPDDGAEEERDGGDERREEQPEQRVEGDGERCEQRDDRHDGRRRPAHARVDETHRPDPRVADPPPDDTTPDEYVAHEMAVEDDVQAVSDADHWVAAPGRDAADGRHDPPADRVHDAAGSAVDDVADDVTRDGHDGGPDRPQGRRHD